METQLNNIISVGCPFCTVDIFRTVATNDHALAIYDSFPISPGHTLIIPRRHITSIFDAAKEVRDGMFDLLESVRHLLIQEHKPDGFNIGINDGMAAGQTVMHLHIHLIPRYKGDMHDPRGGVRWIFPDKAADWK